MTRLDLKSLVPGRHYPSEKVSGVLDDKTLLKEAERIQRISEGNTCDERANLMKYIRELSLIEVASTNRPPAEVTNSFSRQSSPPSFISTPRPAILVEMVTAPFSPARAGMTGTAESAAEEFSKLYALDIDVIPTHLSICRAFRQAHIFASSGTPSSEYISIPNNSSALSRAENNIARKNNGEYCASVFRAALSEDSGHDGHGRICGGGIFKTVCADIHSASRHIGGNGHRALFSRAGDYSRFLSVILGIKHGAYTNPPALPKRR